ncbi:D-alanyl-D-alanine carboxypeptidase family protein [Paenibacillus sediminis]|uniref:serine-type D-Ala-D-Ala carboxypeptidase n=1 Tax=Paenibacillus sediminis TaxID=664909 RepID=A0ABS4GZJ6_9BACL|nr:D-alanyl-D-alanine carboxypeptidase family protein [Paenibacillus sediminis]MBP1935702.1 D-alanyl-D-alanine carboxypeptidase (penicillin-binding protein 5/6) [Paenibacillus sediminis]
MKKWLLAVVAALSLAITAFPLSGFAEEKAASEKISQKASASDLAASARSAILMDADTGTVIYEKNSHEKLPPASITKIMTMLLTMEAIDEGKIKLEDKVQTSDYAASMGGSQIFLEPGEEMTVNDLLKGVAMASGNDASVALAEKISGTEEAFVALMNERAEQLGLKDTHFANCNGLPANNHYSSAHDIAVISRELLKHSYITKYTGTYQDYLRKDSEKPFWLVNTNKLVRFYSGADGLKTGYTSEAKFCLSATALRDGMRVVAVVLGEPNTKTRNNEVSKMFDYAFAQYTMHPIYKLGDEIGKVKIQKGKTAVLTLKADQSYSVLLKKGGKKTEIRHELQVPAKLMAPVKEGQVVGKLVVYQGDQVLKEYELKSPTTINKAGWWTLFKRTTSKLFFVK